MIVSIGDGGFTRLAVADDQFALSATDRNHRVNRFQTGLKRFFNRLTVNNSGRDAFDRIKLVGDNFAFAVNRLSERVNDATDQRVADRNAHNALCAFDFVAFFDFLKIAEKHRSDLVFFEVECETANVVTEIRAVRPP